MAIAYNTFNNKDRHVGGKNTEAQRVPLAPPTDVALHRGDLTYRQNATDRPVPGSELGAAFASLAVAQEEAHDRFWGVNQTPVPDNPPAAQGSFRPTLSRAGYYRFPLNTPTNTLQDGDILGVHAVDIGGGNFQIVDNVLNATPVAGENLSICVARVREAGVTIDEVEVEIIPSIFKRGVQPIQ